MPEIEIEKKFLLSKEEIERLIHGAEDLGEHAHTDTYYDTNGYRLTKQDYWLRKRDAIFELKIPLSAHNHVSETRYREMAKEDDIRNELGLPAEGSFEETLLAHGICPFGTWTTTRHAYKKDQFTIDVDHVDYGSFQHDIVEIELIVPDAELAQEAADRIHAFAAAHSIHPERVPGKVTYYLQRERPRHYAALIEAGS